MTKRFHVLLAVFVLITTVLAGCGGGNGNNSSPAASGSSTNTASVSPTPSASGEKAKLTIGSWRTEDREAYEKIIAAYNATNPNVEIVFNPSKNTEYNTILNTALQTGEGPDIIQLRPYAAGRQLADAGFLEPLDGQIKGLDTFSKDTLAAATGTDGKVYGVPTVYSSTQVFYNVKIFKENNIEVPKTWDDMIKAAETLKAKGITPFAFGSKEGWLLSLTHGALAPQFYGGSDFATKVLSGETNFQSEGYVSSLQMMKDLTPYFPENYEGLGMDDIRNLFVTEQAGMFVMGDWELAVMQKANPALELGVFPVPGKDGKATVTTWVDGSFAVNAKSKNKAEALKFVEFMTTKEFGTLVVNELKKPSTLQGVTATDPIVSQLSEYANTIATPYASVVYFNQGNPTTKSVLETNLQAMYLGSLTPKQVADEVQKSADTWLKK
ncbi:sugar ABC transporter substrate-binding protein [Cohnella kolymensis]|uniref:Sugar ABC transporter substrate-binding protein n=1 Tax=Cohnella kolymensis TaxID=1590652 RepID=A0ABR5A4V3_9BACL|nr:extracellular solute-binding protein [Cohnella kolymensis]KIL36035.1 sugar ABC transporter substrate-binding protein [Cohnella kolymensis]